jgi:hypothetical protein
MKKATQFQIIRLLDDTNKLVAIDVCPAGPIDRKQLALVI